MWQLTDLDTYGADGGRMDFRVVVPDAAYHVRWEGGGVHLREDELPEFADPWDVTATERMALPITLPHSDDRPVDFDSSFRNALGFYRFHVLIDNGIVTVARTTPPPDGERTQGVRATTGAVFLDQSRPHTGPEIGLAHAGLRTVRDLGGNMRSHIWDDVIHLWSELQLLSPAYAALVREALRIRIEDSKLVADKTSAETFNAYMFAVESLTGDRFDGEADECADRVREVFDNHNLYVPMGRRTLFDQAGDAIVANKKVLEELDDVPVDPAVALLLQQSGARLHKESGREAFAKGLEALLPPLPLLQPQEVKGVGLDDFTLAT